MASTSRNAFCAAFPGCRNYVRPSAMGCGRVRENPLEAADFPFTERHLQCAWNDRAWQSVTLRSSDGEDVRVESPGRWNLEAGPDFLDADLVVGAGARRVRGDVEIHIAPRDWQGHRHPDDRRYRHLAAHVTYLPGTLAPGALPPGTLQLSLRDALRANPRFAFEGIDVTAYPYAVRPGSPSPCGDAVASWTPEHIAAFLDAAGEERLRVKTVRLEAAVRERGGEEALYVETMGALGYKHNSASFRQLARSLPAEELREVSGCNATRAYACLLGVAGLLPTRPAPRWDDETREFVRTLWDIWWKERSRWERQLLPKDSWRLANLRPHNHPIRRLAAAAGLFSGPRLLSERIMAVEATQASAWFRQVEALLTDCSAMIAYWKRRVGLAGAPQPDDVALIGPGRRAAILANVFIPFVAANEIPVTALLPHLPAEDDNALARQTAFVLLGRDHNPAAFRTGLRQQGLLQIFHDYCLADRSGCRECPLPAALRGLTGAPPDSRLAL